MVLIGQITSQENVCQHMHGVGQRHTMLQPHSWGSAFAQYSPPSTSVSVASGLGYR